MTGPYARSAAAAAVGAGGCGGLPQAAAAKTANLPAFQRSAAGTEPVLDGAEFPPAP